MYLGLYNQLYLVLPVEAQRVTGTEAAVGAVFAVSTVVGIGSQLRITRWCRARWQPGTCVAVGLALMGAAFVPLAVSSPFLPTLAEPGEPAAALVAGLPVVVATAVFTVGMAMTDPFTMALLPALGSSDLAGTYYGFYYAVSAIVAAAVSAMAGALLGWDEEGWRWAPSAALVAVGLLGAVGVAVMQRRGLLAATVRVSS